MLARTRSGLLVFTTLVATPFAGCSSTHSQATTDPNGTTDSVGATGGSGGMNNSGGGSGGTKSENGGAGGTSSADSDTEGSGAATAGGAGGTSAGAGGSSAGGGGAGAPSELPYANVVAVTASGSDGSYTLNVSVESSDIDCSQFADWWEVVSEDGALLYRRILEHSHTDENGTSDAGAPGNTFTRSGGPVDLLADEVVIVRAHLSTLDEYNGTAMRGSVEAGFVTASDLDPNFAADLESADPQPEGCLF